MSPQKELAFVYTSTKHNLLPLMLLIFVLVLFSKNFKFTTFLAKELIKGSPLIIEMI